MMNGDSQSGSNTPINQSGPLQELLKQSGGGGGSPTQGGEQPNGIASLLQMMQGGQQQQVKPSLDHVMAAMHYFSEVNKVIEPILKDEKLGKTNMRPRVFDAAASLIGDRVMTLPDVMNAMKSFPENPAEQKMWLLKLFKSNQIAEHKVLDDYSASGADWQTDMKNSKWSPENHVDHVKSLSGMYPSG